MQHCCSYSGPARSGKGTAQQGSFAANRGNRSVVTDAGARSEKEQLSRAQFVLALGFMAWGS